MDSYILKLIEENKKLKEQLRKSKNFKRGGRCICANAKTKY